MTRNTKLALIAVGVVALVALAAWLIAATVARADAPSSLPSDGGATG